jgi:hypothetical protein
MSAEEAGVLKACPFCGASAHICYGAGFEPGSTDKSIAIVRCVGKACGASSSGGYTTVERAVKNWNTRAALPDGEPVPIAWAPIINGEPDFDRAVKHRQGLVAWEENGYAVTPLFTHPASEAGGDLRSMLQELRNCDGEKCWIVPDDTIFNLAEAVKEADAVLALRPDRASGAASGMV